MKNSLFLHKSQYSCYLNDLLFHLEFISGEKYGDQYHRARH